MTNLLAYKMAFVQLMLTEASDISKKMDLPTPHPLRQEDAKSWMTGPEVAFRGTVRTTNFVFRFAIEDRLKSFFSIPEKHLREMLESTPVKFYQIRRHQNDEYYFRSVDYDELASQPSSMDERAAYHRATNWLSAVSVDVAELEREHGKPVIYRQILIYPGAATNTSLPKEAREITGAEAGRIKEHNEMVKQMERYGIQPPGSNDWVRLPIFHLEWGKDEEDFKNRKFGIPVKMVILGTTKELVELTVNWPNLVKKSLLLPNAAELLRIPDPPQTMKLQRPTNTSSSIDAPATNVTNRTNAPPARLPPLRKK